MKENEIGGSRPRAAKALSSALMVFALVSVPGAVKADPSKLVYGYDGQGRLRSACDARPASGDLTVYRYDAASNRTLNKHSRTDRTIPVGSFIASADGRFELHMQTDGNLVLYQRSGGSLVPLGWSSNTVGSGATIAAFQSDGNFVVYAPSGSVWSSNTWDYHCGTLTIENDGNMVIRNVSGNIVWQTNTGGH